MRSEHSSESLSPAAIVDELPDAVVVVDGDGSIVYVNRAVTDVLGYEPAQLLDHHVDVLVPPDRREAHAVHHAAYLEDPVARAMGDGLLLSARHADGSDIDVTIALVPIPGAASTVAAVIREVTSEQRMIARLSATNELLTAALGGGSRTDVEQRSVDLAREVLDADSSWLVVLDEADRPVALLAGPDGDDWRAAVSSARDVSPHVLSCPIRLRDEELLLVVGRTGPSRPFSELDLQTLCAFAGAFTITVELIGVRVEVDLLRQMADHDRIARELHDRVIQRLFAIAMRLESVASGAKTFERRRIGEAVDALDEVIREIRTTIFDLRRPEASHSLRSAVAAEIDSATFALGFAPSLRFVGAIDDSVGRALTDEAPIVVREMLSNAARHSRAGNVDVTVVTDHDVLRITVDDDGVGLDDEVHGSGLRNLRERAEARGGTFELGNREPAGVRATWTVPISTGSA